MDLRGVIKKLGEEAAYSAKGHFKTADIQKYYFRLIILVPAVTSLITFGYELDRDWAQLLSLLGLIFSTIALLFVNKDILNDRVRHMELGNNYLEVYKEIRDVYFLNEVDPEKIRSIRVTLSKLDSSSSNYPISGIGRYFARKTILNEMDLEWISK